MKQNLITFAGAVGMVLIGVYGLSTLSHAIYDVAPKSGLDGYAIDTTSAAPIAVATASTQEVGATSSAPDAEAGKAAFGKCKACHSLDAKGKNSVGPNLYGVVNRPVASVADYKYSDAMKAKSAERWSPNMIDTYLADVKATVPGNKMAFSGVKSAAERANIIAYLAQNSATPIAAADLGLAAAPRAATAAEAPVAEATAAPAEPVAAAVVYTDPPAPSDEEIAAEKSEVQKLAAALKGIDHQRATYSPLHFKPAIDKASNGECLVCHQEILDTKVRDASPAGLKAADTKAWYQTLATYEGEQMTFHQRHLSSPYSQAVMNLSCNFCHQGNDPREEAPQMSVAPADMTSNNGKEPFTLRKMVNPSETCLLCHGTMPDPVNIMGLAAAWPEARKDLESAEQPNGCLSCHGELFRTNRHKVSYLNAATIEDLAKESSDVCYGCHGGRAWYRNSYAYPRHPWPGMDPALPDWAKDRKTESDPRYVIKNIAQ